MRLILYGSPQSCELARALIANMKEVKREEMADVPWKLRFVLNESIKETSLIPLLLESGIHGFRLAAAID